MGENTGDNVDFGNGCAAAIGLGVFFFVFAPVVAPVLAGLGAMGIWVAVGMVVLFLIGPFVDD